MDLRPNNRDRLRSTVRTHSKKESSTRLFLTYSEKNNYHAAKKNTFQEKNNTTGVQGTKKRLIHGASMQLPDNDFTISVKVTFITCRYING
uniref:Uncharacterized protein n=1 Tax=Arundo donax TaxID=35708 RepID=A0A0A9D1G7_ARUDO